MADKKKSKLNEAFLAALTRVQYAEEMLQCFYVIQRHARDDYDDQLRKDYNALHRVLHQKLNDAYRHLMYVGNLSNSAETRRKVRAMVYMHAFKENMGIMWLTEPSGATPSKYLTSEEQELRNEVDAAIGFDAQVINAVSHFWKGYAGDDWKPRAIKLRELLTVLIEKDV